MAPRKQFLLRINPEIWREVDRWAADEFRSVNGQIEFLLKRAVDERRRKSGYVAADVAPPAGTDPAADTDANDPGDGPQDQRAPRGRGG